MIDPKKINMYYGVDAPFVILKLVGQGVFYIISSWLLYWWIFSTSPISAKLAFWVLIFSGVTSLLAAIFLVASSVIGKPIVISEMVDRIGLQGSENVLDLGCGTGMLLIEVAKRLSTGHIIGLDIWQTKDQQPNSYTVTLLNANREKVEQKIDLTTGDMRQIPFPDNSFDLVVSSLAIHNVSNKEERKEILREIVRVLKPEGKFSLLDFQYTEEYEEILKNFGCKNVLRSSRDFRMFPPIRIVTGIR